MPESKGQSLAPTTSKSGPPKLALIGCGAIAESYYLPALARHPVVIRKLILVDRDLARARDLATQFNVSACFADYRDVLGVVDGAIVAVPTHLHHPISMEFLSRGMHVLCEKPLASCAREAKEMISQARDTGAILAVNYLQRLWPQFAKVKELLANGSLGEPLSIKYSVGEVFDWPSVSGFYFNAATSGRGVLRDRGSHVLDHICWWLGGKPKLISSQNDSFGGTEAVAEVRFQHGKCTGEVKLSWLSNFPCRFIVECAKGSVQGDVYDFRNIAVTIGAGQKRWAGLKAKDKSKLDVGLRILTNFIRAVSEGEELLVSGGDVLDSIAFIDECYGAATRFPMPWYETVKA